MTAIRYTIPNANVTIDQHADGTSTISVEAARPTTPPIKFGQSITVSQEMISGPIARGLMSTTEAMHRALNAPRFTPRVGDKVAGTGISSGRTRTGYVVAVEPHRVLIAEVAHRDPYGQYGNTLFVRRDWTLKLIEAKPAKPKAGDVLTGDQIRGVPWKRGSVVKLDEPRGKPIVLTEDGDWLPVVSGRPRIAFGDLADAAEFRVIHVGK